MVLELVQLFQEHYEAEGHVDNYFVRIAVRCASDSDEI